MTNWLYGEKPQRCQLTGMSLENRRKHVAMLRSELRSAVISQRGMTALKALIPELGPNGVEPEFDGFEE